MQTSAPRSTPRMHVGIDARCLNTAHLRGMGKYVLEIMRHIATERSIDWTLFGDRPEEILHVPSEVRAQVDKFDIRGFRFHAWEQIGLPLHARRSAVSLLHCTGTTLPRWQPVPTIVTVHDTVPWVFEDQRAYERWYLHTLIPAALQACKAIITISAQSYRDILTLWPHLEGKMHVIPHGVSEAYLNVGQSELTSGLRDAIGNLPYILYVGGGIRRKRFDWALQVFQTLATPDLLLVVCGFSSAGIIDVIKNIGPDLQAKIRFLAFVAEADMPALYQNAVAVLYPTLYEGFGLPAIEAQAVGTPVLFSAVGSLQELAGPSAEVLPTHDMNAWVSALRRLLRQRLSTKIPCEKARLWARRYSWSISAQRHLEIYRKVATV